jgi:hypothetical protein
MVFLPDSASRTSTLDTWSELSKALGNNLNFTSPWVGKIFLVAIYDRTLDEDEIILNFNSGYAAGEIPPGLPGAPIRDQ